MAAYEKREVLRVVDAGPGADEDWFRLQVSGAETSKMLNVSAGQLRRIAAILNNERMD